jgi:hypothetical protein
MFSGVGLVALVALLPRGVMLAPIATVFELAV